MEVDAKGTPFGRYLLVEQIGHGGMGEVWRAYDTVTERTVALKVLPTQFADDAVFQERFRREARSAAALDEPHVVPIYDFGEINGRLFVTMRLIRGRDLHGILRDGPIDPGRAVGIIDQVASALHAAHQVDLVHRDVKPSNILVTDDDFAYLIDFGIARAAGQTGLTSTSSVIGTWAYMAPERFSTGQAAASSDVYALACVLYECLTGTQPFGGDSLEQQIGGHIAMPPPRASERRLGVPPGLDLVISKGMAKNPEDRYPTTRDMARAARAALGAPATGPNTVPPTRAAPFMNAHTDFTHRGGPADQTVVASGPPPGVPTHLQSMPGGPNLNSPKRSRKGLLIGLSSLGAVVAIVVAIVLSQFGNQPSPPAPSTSAVPSAIPNTGPFTGTFTAAMGPKITSQGATANSDVDFAPFSETWHLRSACGTNGCVATASTGSQYPVKEVVFSNVGGRWLAVTTSRRKCLSRDDDEAWNVILLQPQPDGTMSGEMTQAMVNSCFSKRTIAFTRTADTDISLLPDPATLAPRVVSPAEALHGAYDDHLTFSNGSVQNYHFGVRTDCLRTGDRCMSYFIGDGTVTSWLFADGNWTANEVYDARCPTGGTSHVTHRVTVPLPQPAQDPISKLTGHGYQEEAGSTCTSKAFDETMTRTGD